MRVLKGLSVLMLGAAIAAPALAEESTWVPLDQRIKDFRPYLTIGGGVANGVDSKDTVGMFTLGAGIKVGRYIAVEVNRLQVGEMNTDLGTATLANIEKRTPADGPGVGVFYDKKNTKLEGFGVGLVGYIPVNNSTRGIVRGDFYNMKSTNRLSGAEGDFNPATQSLTPTTKNEENDLSYFALGLGAEKKLAPNTFLRGQGQYFTSDLFGGDEEGENFFSLNVQLMQRL